MSVSILIISDGDIGASLISTAKQMIGRSTLKIKALNANIDLDTNIEATLDELYTQASSLVKEIDQGDGVLILTDLFGSTPSNIARRLYDKNNISIAIFCIKKILLFVLQQFFYQIILFLLGIKNFYFIYLQIQWIEIMNTTKSC